MHPVHLNGVCEIERCLYINNLSKSSYQHENNSNYDRNSNDNNNNNGVTLNHPCKEPLGFRLFARLLNG